MVIVIASLGCALLLLSVAIVRPRSLATGVGRIFGFVVILVLPGLAVTTGTSEHIERSKTVAYCTSCHVMEKYGKSLMIDDPRYLPAAHYQNGRVPRETACFSCHTTYAMYGDIKAKLHGLSHVRVNYLGTIPDKLALYEPYNNRECLHCHEATRGLLETGEHTQNGALERIRKNELSCLSSGCHSLTHAVDQLDKLKFWDPSKQEETK